MSKDLFVIMPFGTRSAGDAAEGVDFDRVYTDIIKAAAADAGWVATRIDDEGRQGDISHHFIERLFQADLVAADVSLPNGNVFYELGIRHGIATGGTILLARKGLLAHNGLDVPFDIQNQRTIFYRLTDEGIQQARTDVAEAIRKYTPAPGQNSVRSYLERVGASANPTVDSARFEAEFNGRIERAGTYEQLRGVWNWAKNLSPQPLSPMLRLARRFGELSDWSSAVEVLRIATLEHDTDYEVHRQLAWSLRKLEPTPYEDVEVEFKRALALNPEDPEALGMLGGVYKRLGRYSDARDSYERAATLAPTSDYIVVNQAAMAVLASPQAPDSGVTLYRHLLQQIGARTTPPDIWTALVAGEAAFAVGDDEYAAMWYGRALQPPVNPVPLESAADQLDLFAAAGFRGPAAARHSQQLRNAVRGPSAPVRMVETRPKEQDGAIAAQTRPWPVLVHLSDLHFGSRPDGKPMHRFVDGDYSQPLVRHLEREFKGPVATFGFLPERLHLIVSGDLTYTAESTEFDAACAFLKEVSAILNIPRERVHIVPGNHDVHWGSSNVNRFDNYVGMLDAFYGSTLLKQRYPYLKWDLKTNTVRDPPSNLLALQVTDQLVIVGLNSCVYETKQDHFGFVGGRQMQYVDDWLYSQDAKSLEAVARVAVVHHHLHPFPESLTEQRGPQEIWQDLSTIRDAGLVERGLELRRFDLVLHGHKHHAQLRETLIRQQYEAHRASARLIVCGCGSTGVARTELEHGDGNHYEVIELLQIPRRSGASFVKVHWRELAYRADAQWRTGEVWTLDG